MTHAHAHAQLGSGRIYYDYHFYNFVLFYFFNFFCFTHNNHQVVFSVKPSPREQTILNDDQLESHAIASGREIGTEGLRWEKMA